MTRPFFKAKPERTYDFCRTHGDLSKFDISASGLTFGHYTPNGFCGRCFGEWLEQQFPVERRTEQPK